MMRMPRLSISADSQDDSQRGRCASSAVMLVQMARTWIHQVRAICIFHRYISVSFRCGSRMFIGCLRPSLAPEAMERHCNGSVTT